MNFPVLKYFPVNSNRMYTYSGNKNIEEMKSFVQTQGWQISGGEPLPGSKK